PTGCRRHLRGWTRLTALFGDEPSPPLLAHFLEHSSYSATRSLFVCTRAGNEGRLASCFAVGLYSCSSPCRLCGPLLRSHSSSMSPPLAMPSGQGDWKTRRVTPRTAL